MNAIIKNVTVEIVLNDSYMYFMNETYKLLYHKCIFKRYLKSYCFFIRHLTVFAP